MKKILPFSLITIAALFLAACGGARSLTPSYASTEAPAMMELPAMAPEAGFVADQVQANSGSGVPAATVERLVIQNADISIVVSEVETRMKNIQIMAQQMGGFVVSSNLYQSYTSNYVEVPEAQIVIRVPSEKLEEALGKIKKDVVEVQNETRSGQDVTAEYVDLKSRLKNLEAAEAQLNEIMQTATETEDVVNIFNQLVYYREQIEIVKGQMKYYEEAAALSAITIRIIAEEKDQPIEIGGWEPKGIARDAIQDLIYFYQDFVNFVIRFVIYILPVWITIGVPLYLIFIGFRAIIRKLRGNKKKVEPKAEVEEEKK
ncbi:MAG: DUF4349 domain-containing protein [Anaerolineales bacterium]|nr:DUF4349 domain-containing protein [Anaerolineales bacterium]